MAGVRRQSGQDALVSILRKLETMVENTNQSYEQSLVLLSSVEAVVKNEISSELKKQTSILTSIESKISGLSTGSISSIRDSGLGSAIGGIPEALRELVKILGLSAIFGPFMVLGAESLAKSIRIILESSVGISPKAALTSVGFFALVTASKLSELVKVLSGSLGIKEIFGLGLGPKAKQISSAVRTLLSITEPQSANFLGFGADPRRISLTGAMSSVFAINLLSASNIEKLVEVLNKPMSLWSKLFGGMGAAKRLAGSIRQLMLLSVDDPEGPYKGGEIPKSVIIKSVFAIGLLSASNIKGLVEALRPAFFGIFGSGAEKMKKKAEGIATSVRSFLTISEGIDDATMIKSVLAMGVIALSIDTLVSALRRAGIWNPFILIGLKITQLAISTLLKSVNSVEKSGEDMLGAASYLLALSFTISTLIGATVVAAFLAPLVIIGSLALKFMISSIVSIKTTMDKNQVDETFIEKVSKLIVATSAIIGVAILISNFSSQNPISTVIGNVILLGVMSFLIIKMTTVLANQIAASEGKIKKIDLLSIAATNLINAITLIILSKAMQNPMGSIQNLLMFGLMQLILVGSIFFVIKAISNSRTNPRSILAYNILILGMVATTMLAILFVRGVGAAALGDIVLFSLMIAAISFTAIFFAKRLSDTFSSIVKAVFALGIWTLGLLTVGAGMLLFAAMVPPVVALYSILTISAVALVAYVIGKNSKEILNGALSIAFVGLSIAVFSLGLMVFKASGFNGEDALVLGLTVGGLALVMYMAGKKSVEIELGAISMILAGAALIVISGALYIFKQAKFGWEDAGILGAVVVGLGLAMATAGTIGFPWIAIGAGQMLIAGAALYLISASLKTFKDVNFGKADADNLEYAIGSIVKAFGIITDTDRQKKMGFEVDPWDLFWGIQALSGAGRVLAGLAEGIKAWANLEVNEWEVINPGTKDAKLVIKSRRKLSKTDFDNAAFGMAKVITAIAEPFAKVGRLEKEGLSGDPLYDAIFGGGLVSTGIESLARSGQTLVNLAAGIKAWANLEITEYEVINAGTKDAKIVPKSIRKMSKSDFDLASQNIGTVVGFLAKEFAKIGKMEADSEGIFSDGYVKKGVESIAGLGKNLLSIAEVITKMANMEIIENEVRIIDGKPQLVVKSVRKIREADLTAASTNIGKVTGFLAKEIAKIGKMEADSEGWFADGYVNKGKEAIAGLGQNILSMADAIIKMANTEITEYRVDEKGNLVPVSTRKMSKDDFVKASENISKILGIIVNGVSQFGKTVEANQASIDKATSALPNMTQALSSAAQPIEEWTKLKDVDSIGGSMTSFFEMLKAVFDPEKNKSISDTDRYFTSFTANIEKMSSSGNSLDKVANNVERIEKSMKLLKESINSIDLKKLTLTDSMMKSIALLSKNPEAIANAIEGSIETAFDELISALKELTTERVATATTIGATTPAPVAPPAPGAPKPGTPAPPQQNAASADALIKALQSVTLRVNVSNTEPIRTRT